MKFNRISVLLLLAGCVSGTSIVPIEYQFLDLPNEQRIELRFKNDTREELCLLPESWPNRAGKINQASGYCVLVVAGQRFPIEDSNTGYCSESDGCALHVSPGEEISATIPYRDFRIPEELTALPKKLEFSTVAVTCR